MTIPLQDHGANFNQTSNELSLGEGGFKFVQIKGFFSRANEPIATILNSNEGPLLFRKGDDNKIAKIHDNILKQCVSIKGHAPYQGEIIIKQHIATCLRC